MTKVNIPVALLLILSVGSNAQEQLKHEKKIYISPENRIYVNKSLPIYIRIATSPEPNAQSYQLRSEETSKYSNPMFFDTEGRNTIRHPWMVDSVTRKVILPLQDVIFPVYADGVPPVTVLKLNNASHYFKNGITYFGKGLKINVEAKDTVSGVETTYLSINQSPYQDIVSAPKTFEEEKEYRLAYYSVDHVGNVESPKFEKFYIDLLPPVTSYEIIGEKKGNFLSSKAFIKLTSKDSLSGVNRILVSINGGPERIYSIPIPLSLLKDSNSKIQYYAIDNVGNKEVAKVINTSTSFSGTNNNTLTSQSGSGFNYYIDNEPPVISLEIVGDQYKGKYLFVSGNSKVKINASDEKSGVAKINYSINSGSLTDTYSEPFTLSNEGINVITFTSADNVGNLAVAKSQQIYMNKIAPVSKVLFRGNQFTNHDTLFITRDTKIIIVTNESGSGIQAINYSIDNGSKTSYTSPFSYDKDGYHTMEYQANDNVNNVEVAKKCAFFVDNIAPEIYYHFSVKAIGEKTVRGDKYDIYPSNTMLYIAATDNASGGEKIEYRINGKKDVYTAIPVKGFIPGNYEIEIVAYDVLKNKSSQVIHFSIED